MLVHFTGDCAWLWFKLSHQQSRVLTLMLVIGQGDLAHGQRMDGLPIEC